MTTLADLVIRTRRRALSDLREETDTLGTAVFANATTLSLGGGQTLGSIRAGAIIECDYELYLVLNNPTSTNAVIVQPGYLDTTSTAHAAGALLTINPRFPQADIATAVNEDLDDLSAPVNGLFQMRVATVVWNPVIIGYDLVGVDPTQITSIYEVRVYDYGPSQRWPLIPPSLYKLQRSTDPAVAPSGLSIKIYGQGFPGRPVRIMYKAPFTGPLLNPSDDVFLITGLHTQAHDIPTLGAAVRLMEFRELKRSFTESQGEPRRAQEVPVGSSLTAMKGLDMRREKRIAAERSRLQAMYPTTER